MEEQKEKILNFISEEAYVPMKAKQIAEIMSVPKNEYSEFTQILKELTLEYKIKVNKKGKYSLVDSKKYKKGKLRINERGFGFVKIEDSDEEIYISGKNINNSLNEDEVLVELLEDSKKDSHREGRIIKIIKRGKDSVVGVFESNKNFGFVIPDDKRFGSDIFISKKNIGKAKNKQKVVVKITKYPENGIKSRRKDNRSNRLI